MKQHPTPEDLRVLLKYDPDTGKLFHNQRPERFFPDTPRRPNAMAIWNSRFAGKEAFTCTDAYGYKIGHICGCGLKAHRVAWAIMTGKWPTDDIDHINGQRSDNRWQNMRSATRAQNLSNGHVTTGTSRFRGVHWANGKWHARLSHKNKTVNIGSFDKEEDAARAFDDAAKRLRGEYASLNFPSPPARSDRVLAE